MRNVLSSLFLAGCTICIPLHAQNGKPQNLRCEHLENPLGIDSPQPRLSWLLQDERPGAVQQGYRIIVGVDSLDVVNNKGNRWDTQWVKKEDQLVTYSGTSLEPFTRYYWKVNIQDKEGVTQSSDVKAFETGMMDITNWQGAWISDHHSIHHQPAPYFRKKFTLSRPVKSARAYIAVGGLYELYMNGEKTGNHRLDPLYTRFDRRNLYVTYDITDQLQRGENAVGVILGNGWYNHQSIGVWDFDRAPWRNRPAFCMDIKITYEDGTTETIGTGLDWRTGEGGIIFNSIYTAEHYNARKEQKGWATPSFDDSKWRGVRLRPTPSQNITAQQVRPIRNVEKIPVATITKISDTNYLFDFGRNIAGVTELKVTGKEGTTVRLIHGERLHADKKHIDLSNIDVYHRPVDDKDPFQTDIVILSGQEDQFMAKFNYKGFRYVEVVTDQPLNLDENNLTAWFMHSDIPQTGTIASSNSLLDRLWWATNNAYLSNLMGYPTDCPQREKNGWTGDGHLAIETALYNYDGITVYEKWLADHRDEQQPNGVLPDIIPTGGWGYGTDNGLDWTSTIAIIPWNIYLFYGDSKLLADCYDNIKRYVNYVHRTSPNHLTSWGRGDWVPVTVGSNKELTSSIYYYTDTDILAKAAKLFGNTEDYLYYSKLAEEIKKAINDKYLNRETGIYASGTQTELSVPLQWNIVPEDIKPKVVKNLLKKVEEAGFHLDVGVLGAKAILNALSENGEAVAAYKVAVQDTYPSWGHWIVNGATTLLENWDLNAPRDISDNHMMFGEIGGWFFKGLGGIKPDPEQPGFKHILLRPNFIKGLNRFECSHDSPYGKIVSKWEYKGNTVTYYVEVPANAKATFYPPENARDNSPQFLTAGKHTIKLKMR